MQYPRHIGIIPDGNRTRAAEQGLPKMKGHLAGFNNAVELVKRTFSETPIEVFTLRGLSTENTKHRARDELAYLFDLYQQLTQSLYDFLAEQQINLKWIGKEEGLSAKLISFMQKKEQTHTYPGSDKYLCLAINYGGRDELLRGVQQRHTAGADLTQLTEDKFGTYLDFGDMPPLELVIRTKGDEAKRLSGFMLRWVAYAELYFTDLKFPAFDIPALEQALIWFDGISAKRNFGK